MAGRIPPVYVICPESDHEWRGQPRAWHDMPGWYNFPCPSCGRQFRLPLESGAINPLRHTLDVIPFRHRYRLTGQPA